MAHVRAGETALLAADLPRTVDFLTDGLLSDLGSQRYLGDCLELVALIQVARNDLPAAATMFGAADTYHDATGSATQVRPIAAESRTQRAQLAEDLGTDQFARYLAEGRALTAEQAIGRARAGLRGSSQG